MTNMRRQTLTFQMLVPTTFRMVHARGYNNFDDKEAWLFHEINNAMINAKNTPNIVEIYQQYGGDENMTPEQIVYGFWFIARNGLEKTPEFWNMIIPLVKKQISTLDRMTVKSLLQAIDGASGMYLQDNEFWEIVEQKLVDEGLYKYYTLEQLGQLVNCLGRVGRGSDDMMELIEKTFIKHRKGLKPEVIKTAQQGFEKLNKGSEILHRVLKDPNTELPALE